MASVIPESVLKTYETLEKNGFEAYFVGGSVRDLIIKRKIKDWDMTTNATPLNKFSKYSQTDFMIMNSEPWEFR